MATDPREKSKGIDYSKTVSSAPAVVIRWHCDGCNKILKQAEVEGYGDGYCHVVPRYNSNSDD